MSRRCLFALVLLIPCTSVLADVPEPDKPKESARTAAQTLWTLTELVLDNHVNAPARQQMLLAGARSLLASADASASLDLAREISKVTTLEQLEELLRVRLGSKTPSAEAILHAIHSSAASIPGGAEFLGPEHLKTRETIESNNYVGIGIQIKMHDKEKLAEIVVPFAGGPFRRAGGKTSDLIVEVDGKSMKGVNLADVVKALRGSEGSGLTTLVRQPEKTETRLLKMVREIIPFQSALGYRRISDDAFEFRPNATLPVAYLHLNSLTSSTYHELRNLERTLQSEGNRALMLDLRATPAGSTLHAAQVADAFLDGGVMWKVHDARGRVKEYKADHDCLFRDWPMIVLVNESTVETAALVAEALQDRGRAILVGAPTEHGGYVKSTVALPDGIGGIHMTTGIVERMKPAKPGITPDHIVKMSHEQMAQILEWQRKQESPDTTAAKAPDDPQLNKAIELLRDKLMEKKDKAAS
jgi:carboxyl-terminal processing protease